MRKFLIGIAVLAVVVTLVAVKIGYEQRKSDREMQQRDGQNMCEIVGCR